MTINSKCQATTASGEQCRRQAGPSGYCYVHDPERRRLQEEAERERQAETESQRRMRQCQLEEVTRVIDLLQEKLRQAREDQITHGLLVSVSDGLYVEIDKLTKKAPAEQVTDLALDQINEVIRDTKSLIQTDRYIQNLNEFVPAGDRPELRDALLILGQVKQGLARFRKSFNIAALENKLRIAVVVKTALEHEIEAPSGMVLLKDILEHEAEAFSSMGLLEDILGHRVDTFELPSRWKVGVAPDVSFNFDYLDSINITEYFTE